CIGGTTVSGTSLLAHAVGINTFVTGGIGGVHRGGEISMDISADLFELHSTPITVVSAGIKSILDIPKTLEVLETLGVCVLTYSSSLESPFPAFFSSQSRSRAPYNVGCPKEIAKMMKVQRELALNSGMLVGVPIAQEHEVPEVESAIREAIQEMEDFGIQGKEVTPFLLSKVTQLTKGDSLEANLALIRNNADVGSRIAKEYAMLSSRSIDLPLSIKKNSPIVVGGAAVDLIAQFLSLSSPWMPPLTKGRCNAFRRSWAEYRSGPLSATPPPILCIHNLTDNAHISVVEGKSTATYCVITMRWVKSRYSPQMIERLVFDDAPLIVLDGNIPLATVEAIKKKALEGRVPVLFEPTDVHKAHKPFSNLETASSITYISPNERELEFILKKYDLNLGERINYCIDLSQEILCYVQVIVVTLAENGVLVIRRGSSSSDPFLSIMTHRVLSSSGAGDCFIAGFAASLLKTRGHQDMAVGLGMQAAIQSLNAVSAVPQSFEALDWDFSANGIHYL
ncbi:Pseudouridinemetabolizing bifunctional protein C186105like, partial [Caligus rogercresseyi]